MALKSLNLFIPILSLIYLHVYGNVLFEEQDVPKDEWLASISRKIALRSPVECAIRCNKMLYKEDMSCNSISFDKSDNTCTLGWYQEISSEESGLRVAWASSIQANYFPWYAIDKKIGYAFFSTKDNAGDYPWLAIDLVRPEKVSKVDIKSRIAYEKRTRDIEVRVGPEKPFDRDTNGGTLYTINTVCGYNAGPATSSTNFVIECSTAIEGRYITVQRIKASTEPALNIVEVLIETEPTVGTIKILVRPSHNDVVRYQTNNNDDNIGQCAKEYPFAYEGGYRCCENGFDDPTDLDGMWRNGFLNFDSKGCMGESQPCPLGCMNYRYERYWCQAHHEIGTTNTKNIPPDVKVSTWKECEDYAEDKNANGWIWHKNGSCWPKKGNVTLKFKNKKGVKVMGIIPCP